ncbi:PTS sugar transporter subunit IIA [Shigella flexneri]
MEQSTISVARCRSRHLGRCEAQFIIMLTLNKHAAGDHEHMRIFSRLARGVMHAEFRNSLVNAASADTIASLLQHELNLEEIAWNCIWIPPMCRKLNVAPFPIAGVTTNPSIVAASRESIWDVLPRLKHAIGGKRYAVCPDHEPRRRWDGRRRPQTPHRRPGIVVKVPGSSGKGWPRLSC